MIQSKLKADRLAYIDESNDEFTVLHMIKNGISVSSKGELKNALTKFSSTGGTIIVVDEITVDEDITIPENVHVGVLKSGLFNISSGKTLTINGPFEAGLYQVFSGDGTITFSNSSVNEIQAIWYKTGGSGTSSDPYIGNFQNALDTGRNVTFGEGYYKFISTGYQYPYQTVRGQGKEKTYIVSEDTSLAWAFADENGSFDRTSMNASLYSYLYDITIIAAADASGLQFAGSQYGGFDRIKITKDIDPGAGSRVGNGIIITGLDKVSTPRGCYYNLLGSVEITYFSLGIYFGNRTHSNEPLTNPKVTYCDEGIIVGDGTDLGDTNKAQPAHIIIVNPNLEVINGDGIQFKSANRAELHGGYFDTIGGNAINSSVTLVLVGSQYFSGITGENVKKSAGSIYNDLGTPLSAVSRWTAPAYNPKLTFAYDGSSIIDIAWPTLATGITTVSGDDTNPTAGTIINFSTIGLPSNLYVAGFWAQVINTDLGGDENSLYIANVSGLGILNGSSYSSMTIRVRKVDGTAISSARTIYIQWFLLTYLL